MTRLSPEDEELERKFQSMPLFMDHIPADGEPMSTHMEALKALLDETDPNDLAEGLKNSGNQAYKLGKHRWADAIQYYTNALEHKITDEDLIATIYGNRAQVHLQLGNLGQALDDCKQSLEYRPDNIKVLYRTAKALILLGRYKDCMDYCVRALKIDMNNESVKKIFGDARDKLMTQRRRQREKQARAAEEQRQAASVREACRERGIHLVEEDDDDDEVVFGAGDSLLDSKPFVDEERKLHWPVLILYPEHHTTDTIRDWHEDVTFREMFEMMLSPVPEWDTQRHYTMKSICVTFRQNESSNKMVLVDLDSTLGDVLKRPEFTVYHNLPTFLVTSKASKQYWMTSVEPHLQR